MSNYDQRSGTTVNADLDGFEYEQRTGTTVDIELHTDGFGISALVNSESVEIRDIFTQIDEEVKEVSEVFAQVDGESRQV